MSDDFESFRWDPASLVSQDQIVAWHERFDGRRFEREYLGTFEPAASVDPDTGSDQIRPDPEAEARRYGPPPAGRSASTDADEPPRARLFRREVRDLGKLGALERIREGLRRMEP